MIRLQVSSGKVENFFDTVSHGIFQTGRVNNWRVNEDGYICATSVLWLFCWAYNGDNSLKAMKETRQIFNNIFSFSFKFFNERVGYDYANRNRYRKRNIEEELKEMLEL